MRLPEIEQVADLAIGDIRDQEAVARGVDGVEAVVHLAAFGSVVESVSDPIANFDVNVRGTVNLLEACRNEGVRRFILASTGGAIIGEAEPPVDERSLPKPISPYGASKLCGEAYCHAYGKAYGMGTVALRFANVYGRHSLHKRGAITIFMKALLLGRPLTIYGDGTASRDFLFADDLCQGIRLALESDLPPGDVIHLASGVETTILSLARQIAEVAGIADPRIEFRPSRSGEISRNFASAEKARRLLGFAPQLDLREGLARTWNWFSARDRSALVAAESDS
jgi:UDP-glucose 4-epimerase